MIRRLKSTIFSSVLIVLLFTCHQLRADLVLAVDFDINQAGIQSDAIVDSNGHTSASIVLFLTGTSTMYAYTFSVRFNTDRLTLNSKDDTPPSVNGKNFIEVLTNEHSVSGSGGGFVHYREINRFDGKIDNNFDEISSADIPPEGVVLGQLNFTVTGNGDDLLVLPGEFEPFQPGQDVEPFDVFLGSDLGVRLFQGGNIIAVPEPSSLLLLASTGMMLAIRRRLGCSPRRAI